MFRIVLAVVSTEAMVRKPRLLIMLLISLGPFLAAAMSQSRLLVSALLCAAPTLRASFCS